MSPWLIVGPLIGASPFFVVLGFHFVNWLERFPESRREQLQKRLDLELRGLERRAARIADAIRMDAQQVSEQMERQARKLRE